MPDGDGFTADADGRDAAPAWAWAGWERPGWLGMGLLRSMVGLRRLGFGVGVALALLWVAPGVGGQLLKAGPELAFGFVERHRQFFGVCVGEGTGTRTVLRGAGVLTCDGDGTGELLAMVGDFRDVSCLGAGAPKTSCAKCCIGLGSAFA